MIKKKHPEERWIRCEMVEGDMITLPAGIYHRFLPDEKLFFKVMRLFVGDPVWTAYNRNEKTDAKAIRQEYMREFLTRKGTEEQPQKKQKVSSTDKIERLPNSNVVALNYRDLIQADYDASEAIREAFGFEGLGILVVKNVPNSAECRAKLLPLARRFSLPFLLPICNHSPDLQISQKRTSRKQSLKKQSSVLDGVMERRCFPKENLTTTKDLITIILSTITHVMTKNLLRNTQLTAIQTYGQQVFWKYSLPSDKSNSNWEQIFLNLKKHSWKWES